MISVGLRFAAAILLGIVASSCTTTSTEAPIPSRTPESLARAGRMLTEDHPKVGIVLVEMTADPRRDQPSTGTDVYSDVSSAVTRSAYEAATAGIHAVTPHIDGHVILHHPTHSSGNCADENGRCRGGLVPLDGQGGNECTAVVVIVIHNVRP